MRVDGISPALRRRLAVVDLDQPVIEAARCLAKNGVDIVIACDSGGVLQGLLSRGDLIRHIASSDQSQDRPIEALMTRNAVCCRPADDLSLTWQLMNRRALRNLPVLDLAGRPVGVLNLDDALQALLRFETGQETMLLDYIAGVGYR
ncbi:MAG TPA: CBS domain-containing protein [Devosiaceae bacterium]|jgi:CBS domain-containing protein|nr:CBS domain-containing protein [Devosiaceae bacterium]